MTIEERALQAELDRNPLEQTLRLALADHLEDIGDPRADGYRAMSAIGFAPDRYTDANRNYYQVSYYGNCYLKSWRREGRTLALSTVTYYWLNNVPKHSTLDSDSWRIFEGRSRQAVEDILANAFATLSDEQKVEACKPPL